jgi:hypothetical protein
MRVKLTGNNLRCKDGSELDVSCIKLEAMIKAAIITENLYFCDDIDSVARNPKLAMAADEVSSSGPNQSNRECRRVL